MSAHADCRRYSFIFCFAPFSSSWMNIWLETKGEPINYSSCRALVLLWKELTFELSRRHLQIYMPSIVWGSQTCIKGCKRPCQFIKDNSTKTPFFSVVMGIMLLTRVLSKPNLATWYHRSHWQQTSTMETIKLLHCEISPGNIRTKLNKKAQHSSTHYCVQQSHASSVLVQAAGKVTIQEKEIFPFSPDITPRLSEHTKMFWDVL